MIEFTSILDHLGDSRITWKFTLMNQVVIVARIIHYKVSGYGIPISFTILDGVLAKEIIWSNIQSIEFVEKEGY